MESIRKYPRTPHLQGSRLQPGDEDLSQIPFSQILGKHIVIEEKIDGANCAISFSPEGKLLLQSRGHYLTGGYRERHFDLLKQWATVHQDIFRRVLGDRYIMYGEWVYAKHSVYYDALPSYFMEFDILDRETDRYLDTPSRRKLTAQMPVASAAVLGEGCFASREAILSHLGHSRYIRPGHLETLRAYCEKNAMDADARCAESDPSTDMEGLYIKVEENGEVAARMKFVRPSFAQVVQASPDHWMDRPIVPNLLCVPLESLFQMQEEG